MLFTHRSIWIKLAGLINSTNEETLLMDASAVNAWARLKLQKEY